VYVVANVTWFSVKGMSLKAQPWLITCMDYHLCCLTLIRKLKT